MRTCPPSATRPLSGATSSHQIKASAISRWRHTSHRTPDWPLSPSPNMPSRPRHTRLYSTQPKRSGTSAYNGGSSLSLSLRQHMLCWIRVSFIHRERQPHPKHRPQRPDVLRAGLRGGMHGIFGRPTERHRTQSGMCAKMCARALGRSLPSVALSEPSYLYENPAEFHPPFPQALTRRLELA